VFNSAVRVMELAPGAREPAAWEPVVWECSSALAMLLLVWPVVWFTRAWPYRHLKRDDYQALLVMLMDTASGWLRRRLIKGGDGGH